jgi:serine protease Do
VVITNVMPGSPAAEKGLQAGDVIVEADRSAVTEPQAVVDAVKKVSERGDAAILLLVKREGQSRYVAVPLQSA